MRAKPKKHPSDFPIAVTHAQLIVAYRIGTDGEDLPRIRFGDAAGDEIFGWSEACKGCRVAKGDFHIVGCDQEACPSCEWLIAACDCFGPDQTVCLDASGKPINHFP